MSVRAVAALVLCAASAACAGGTRRSEGPPPEYERPPVPEWDAGKAVDPLEQAVQLGEPVDEPEGPDSVPDAASADDAAPEAGTP